MTRIVTPGVFLACLVAVAVSHSAEPKAASHALRVVRDKTGHPIAVEAVGLSATELSKLSKQDDAHEQFSQLLKLFVVNDASEADLPSITGAWSVVESALRFTPRYPLNAGIRYRAVLRPAVLVSGNGTKDASPEEAAKPITLDVSSPAAEAGEPTVVIQIYPSAATLPENNLRFYIHFSDSMGRGEAYEHLHLLDATGKPIEAAFLEIGEELWDPRARRMTLLIDPGRIKKGVKPREELGPVLEAGREYTLVVNREWRNAAGQPLKSEFRKKFRVGPPVEKAIDPANWKTTPPSPGSSDPLVLRFPAPLDRALLERTISVAGLDGPAIAGRTSVSEEERRWEFRPHAPWKAGRYQLVVDTALEDLAGNRIGKPFEIDVFNEVDKSTETESTRLPFEIRDRS